MFQNRLICTRVQRQHPEYWRASAFPANTNYFIPVYVGDR